MNEFARARLLPVVILALSAFTLLKIGNVWFGFSSAEAQQSISGNSEHQSAPNAVVTDAARSDAKPPAIAPGEVERRILEQLATRRKSLEEREEKLAAREAVAAAAELRLNERLAQFEQERDQLSALRQEQEAAQAEEIDGLVSAYEKMKSKDAAVIFNALEPDILVPVAAGMRTQALAGVLAKMQPEKARELTRLLAERKNTSDGFVNSEASSSTRDE